jgi:hypothetical protein
MIISIQLQTSEDLVLLDPVIKLLQKSKVKYSVQSKKTLDKRRKIGIQKMLYYLQNDQTPSIKKIQIPNREENNER